MKKVKKNIKKGLKFRSVSPDEDDFDFLKGWEFCCVLPDEDDADFLKGLKFRNVFPDEDDFDFLKGLTSFIPKTNTVYRNGEVKIVKL